jgi:uncharacterized protein (TIGR02231 family)
MKRAIILILIVMATATTSFAELTKDIRANIKHVTVYPDRAQITQESAVEISAGKTVLKLGALSPYIDPQSIQVKGTGEFTIISVNHQNNYLENLEDLPEIKSIRSQIEGLQAKVEDEQAAINVLNEKQQFLIANRAVLDKKTTITIDQLKSVMDLYTSNIEQVATTILKKNRLIKDYQKQIEALRNQIADKTNKERLPSGEISVTVSADKTVTAKLNFSYVCGNAGWYPTYDVRVDDISKPVSIIFKANVFQNTGIDWKDVSLSFSNASPSVSGDFPVLYPWFVDYYQPEPIVRGYGVSKKSGAPIMAESVAADRMMAKEEVNAPAAAAVEIEKKVGETTVSFDVAIPCSISADSKVQTIELQKSSVTADYKYITVPKANTLAFLTASITDWAKLSLMSGEATLYFENTFVGKSNINVAELKDTLTLSLGSDQSIIVKREKRQDFTSRKVFGSNKTEIYSFLITVRNNKPTPVTITIDDQIPVSSNSGITVEAPELSGGKLNAQTGMIKWDLTLKPQESKQLILTYSVKYPKDKTIILE